MIRSIRPFCLVLVACCCGAITMLPAFTASAATADAIDAGDQFPDFALRRSDGSLWSLDAHAGQPKLVMFWATWCPYCRRLMPGIVRLDQEFAADGLEVVGVNFRDDGDTDAYAAAMGIQFDIVLDGDELAGEVGVHGTPTVFVLDADNRVRLRTSHSDPDNAQLRAAVESVLP